MTAAVLLTILACALLDSLNPSVIGVTLYLLLTGERNHAADSSQPPSPSGVGTPTRSATTKVLTYVGTVAATYLTIGTALKLGLGAFSSQIARAAEHPAAHALIGAAGIALFAWSWIDSSKDTKDPNRHAGKKSRLPTSDRLGALVSLGIVVTVLEFSTAAPYLATLGLLTAEGVGLPLWLPILVGYVAVMNLPPLLLLLAHRLLRDRIRDRLERWRDKVVRNSRKTMQWILGIVGFLLARHGIALLLVELGIID